MNKMSISIILLSLLWVSAVIMGKSEDVPHERLNMACEECHTTELFTDIDFDHGRLTSYDLEDGHETASCLSCHDLKDFSSVEKHCFNCHQDVHESKMGPNCERCHSSSTWTRFDFQEIHIRTDFPFMGRHAMLDCQSCHQSLPQGDVMMDRTRCVDCHQTDYLNAAGPNHVSDGFSTECQNCHRMNGWQPATIPNHDVYFPIYNGEHAGAWADCATCHIDPNDNKNFSCLTCHSHNQTEMDGEHSGIIGYAYNSQDCYLCHPDGKARDFREHDAQYFPIYSGVHSSEWLSCTECHTVPSDRKQFDCLSCHVHRQEEMDGKHGGMSGYGYDSQLCYQCHPQGTKGQFTAHDVEFFPIFSGRHSGIWAACIDCHADPNDIKVYDCLTCHPDAEVDPVHNGMSGYLYESTSCFSCHPTGEAGDFVSHDDQFFPIFSGAHSNQWTDCTSCHTLAANKTVFDCISCHQAVETNLLHGSMSGYAAVSDACYSCHPTGIKGSFTGHDTEFFPIFAGKHAGEWTDCVTCHTVAADRTSFSCFECHSQAKMDDKHLGGVPGYDYDSDLCLSCHPDGTEQ